MGPRLVALGLIAAATVVAAVALAVSAWGEPQTDVVLSGGVGSHVVSVFPAGPIWAVGIRPGQTVIEIRSGVDAHSWTLATTEGSRQFGVTYAYLQTGLRAGALPAAVALGLAAIAWLTIRRLFLAAAFAVLAVTLASSALLASGLAATSTVAVAAATAAPAIWLAAWPLRARWRTWLAAFGGAVVIAWLVSCLVLVEVFDAVELARRAYLTVSVIAVVIVVGDWRHWHARLLTLDAGRLTDLFAIAAVVTVLVMVAIVTEMPVVLLAATVGGLALLYPSVRKRLAKTLDELVFGDYRGRASLAAVETERGRIARDLHDAPLQEIAAVIRELDTRGGSESQVDVLRRAAGNLRRVTAELRPPVLDDLGLPAAIAYVAQAAAIRCPTMTINACIDPTEPLAERAPLDVELGVFRIVQEAVENAIRHSRAGHIKIVAKIRADEVVASVADDGHGIGKGAERKALREGHVGLTTMAQRAGLIHAELHVGPTRPSGTVVRVHWRALS